MPEEWLTVKEAVAYLKISPPTLYRWMAAGALPYYTIPQTRSRRRFKRSDLDAIMEQGSSTSSSSYQSWNRSA